MPGIVQFIVNGSAGSVKGMKARQRVTDLLEEAFPGAEIVYTDENTDVTGAAKKAVKHGAGMVVAGGGDGTVNSVASALVGKETVLGLLPLGTLNNFAGDLGIPSDMKDAVQVLKAGRVAKIDVGQVNDRIFVNNSGLGLYPSIVQEREKLQDHQAPKWPAAFLASLRAFARYRLLTIEAKIEGERLARETPVVFVGNSHYALEGWRIGRRERLDDGKLCLYISHHYRRLSLLWFPIATLSGKRYKIDHFDIPEKGFRIESPRRQLQVSIDGEVTRMSTPLRYRMHAGGLRVMVPRKG